MVLRSTVQLWGNILIFSPIVYLKLGKKQGIILDFIIEQVFHYPDTSLSHLSSLDLGGNNTLAIETNDCFSYLASWLQPQFILFWNLNLGIFRHVWSFMSKGVKKPVWPLLSIFLKGHFIPILNSKPLFSLFLNSFFFFGGFSTRLKRKRWNYFFHVFLSIFFL